MSADELTRTRPPPRVLPGPSRTVALWVVQTPNGDVPRAIPLPSEGSLRLGRGTGAAALDDAWCSSHHLTITAVGAGTWRVTDASSLSGSRIRGDAVPVPNRRDPAMGRLLQVGDVLRVGASVLVCAEVGPTSMNGPVVRGWSAGTGRLRETLAGFVPTLMTLHLHGETGTGKNHTAEAVHQAAVAAGYRRGELRHVSLAGAGDAELGPALSAQFAAAVGSTLVLDDVAEVPQALQARLLGTLETRPRGVRLITTSRVDLGEVVQGGGYRPDLYLRLAEVPLGLQPLRTRRLDVVPITEHLLQRHQGPSLTEMAQARGDRGAWEVADLVECLCVYDWPLNVRQLETELRKLVVLAGGRLLTSTIPYANLLPAALRANLPAVLEADSATPALDFALMANPTRLIQVLREDYRGDVVSLAAAMAGDLGVEADAAEHMIRTRVAAVLRRIDSADSS